MGVLVKSKDSRSMGGSKISWSGYRRSDMKKSAGRTVCRVLSKSAKYFMGFPFSGFFVLGVCEINLLVGIVTDHRVLKVAQVHLIRAASFVLCRVRVSDKLTIDPLVI